jgi:hypothetical protein
MVNPWILDPDAVHHVQEVLGVHGQHVGRGQHPPAQQILLFGTVTANSFFPYVMRYIFCVKITSFLRAFLNVLAF